MHGCVVATAIHILTEHSFMLPGAFKEHIGVEERA